MEETEKLCEGCVCKIVSDRRQVALDQVCHGMPFIFSDENEKIATCPCTECLIKTMCSDEICDKYSDHRSLLSGAMTIKEFKERN